jgi:3-hydroxyacyl-[acyl-carrier-protein] dehydratase
MSILEKLTPPQAPDCIMDYAAIQELLPHRYPFLFIDRVNSFNGTDTVVCQKNVSFNEPFFAGHFPNEPVMPGVIQIEAMAQAACVLIYLCYSEENVGKRPAFMGVNEARFRKPVRPGDILTISATVEKYRRGIGTVACVVKVGDVVVSDCTLMATMV